MTRIEPIYRPNGEDGEIVLYAGRLAVVVDDREEEIEGQLELRLFPHSEFIAHFAGTGSALARLFVRRLDEDLRIRVPDGQSLTPPPGSLLPKKPDGGSWGEDRILLPTLEAGDLDAVDRLLVHTSQSIQKPRF